jgi:hypothetical protein
MEAKDKTASYVFPTLPGLFAIRTKNAGTYVTARSGGLQIIDALITPSQAFTPFNTYTFEGYVLPDQTRIRVYDGLYLFAAGGGGVGAGEDTQTFLTTAGSPPPDNSAIFLISRPDSAGLFTIRTIKLFYVTANEGGGQTTRAFHTDAKVASSWEQFYITKVGDLGDSYYYAFRAVPAAYNGDGPSYGAYLSATNGGGLTTGNAITAVHELGITTTFRLVSSSGGSYGIQTSNGKNYVTADLGGGLAHGSANEGNLQTDRTGVDAWEEFNFVDQKDGTYGIQTKSGFFIGVGLDGTISTRISDLTAAYNIGYSAKFELVMIPPLQ